MTKKIISLFAAIILSLMLVIPVFAEGTTAAANIPADRQLPLLVDNAGVLSDEQASALLKKLEEKSAEVECDFAVVTVTSLDGKNIADYADDFYDYNGYGYGDDDDGLLLLISTADRQWWITTYGVGKKLSETDIEYAVNDYAEPLSSGDYNTAFNGIMDNLYSKIYNERHPSVAPKWIFIDLVFGFVIAYIFMKARTSNLKSVRSKVNANEYVVPGSLALNQSYDTFLYRNVSRTERKDSSSGNGSHTSSSGRSHGGSGGSF